MSVTADKEPTHLKTCLLCGTCRVVAKKGAPDRDEAVAEGSDFDIDMHPQCTHEAPHGAHEAEYGYVPDIIEHARAVERQAVGVQPKIAVAPKMRVQNVLRVLLQAGHKQECQRGLPIQISMPRPWQTP